MILAATRAGAFTSGTGSTPTGRLELMWRASSSIAGWRIVLSFSASRNPAQRANMCAPSSKSEICSSTRSTAHWTSSWPSACVARHSRASRTRIVSVGSGTSSHAARLGARTRACLNPVATAACTREPRWSGSAASACRAQHTKPLVSSDPL